VDYSTFNCRVLEDKFPDAGPLAGIERALAAAKSPLLLVLAVDLPQMNTEFLRRLAAHTSATAGAIPRLANNLEPLAAFYPGAAHALAADCLARGVFAVKDFAGQCVRSGLARYVEISATEADRFTNWNSPADLTRAGNNCVAL
jgi:molybdopterin-guanine dinucleotide biosynthesis protein A